ncbi:MAG: hypothetical protein RL370_1047, partial [Actinomycetota bacterium]
IKADLAFAAVELDKDEGISSALKRLGV